MMITTSFFLLFSLLGLRRRRREESRATMSMLVGENFRKISTLVRNSLIIFSCKLFDGTIYYIHGYTRSIKSTRVKGFKS